MEAALNILSLALFGLVAVAYARRHRVVLAVGGTLFFPICAAALTANWWQISPWAALALVACTLGVSLVVLTLFAVDVLWAPFCVEMTYLTFLCWVLCPLAVLLSHVGALLQLAWAG